MSAAGDRRWHTQVCVARDTQGQRKTKDAETRIVLILDIIFIVLDFKAVDWGRLVSSGVIIGGSDSVSQQLHSSRAKTVAVCSKVGLRLESGKFTSRG